MKGAKHYYKSLKNTQWNGKAFSNGWDSTKGLESLEIRKEDWENNKGKRLSGYWE